VYQRGVKIISVAEFAIMINTLALCACRDKSLVTLQSKTKMIMNAAANNTTGITGALAGRDA